MRTPPIFRIPAIVACLALSAGIGFAQEPASPDSADIPVQKLDLKAGMHAPKATFISEAQFSSEARSLQINGKCSIALIVDANGIPQKVHVVRCSNPVFEKASLATTKQDRFTPATSADGKPIAVQMYIEVAFRRDDAGEVIDPIRVGIAPLTDTQAVLPDSNGIYPLNKSINSPKLTKFVDQGYAALAFTAEGKSPASSS